MASTITPALTAFTAFVVIRRWAPWTPAAFVGGLLYGFSPFVLSSLEFAHLMTAALMLLPLILAVLDEILIRQRHGALGAGLLLGLLVFAQFFLSSEMLAIVAVVVVICLVALVLAGPGGAAGRRCGPGPRTPSRRWRSGSVVGRGAPGLARLVRPEGAGQPLRPGVAQRGGDRRLHPVELRHDRRTRTRTNVFLALGGYEGAPLASAAYVGWSFLVVMVAGLAAFWRDRRLWFFGFAFVGVRGVLPGRAARATRARLDLHQDPGASRTSLSNASWPSASWPPR